MTVRGRAALLAFAAGILWPLSGVSAQGWSNEEIDAWFRDLESVGSWADQNGDHTCAQIIGAAGAGYSNPKLTSVSWNNNLRTNKRANGVTYTNPITGNIRIEIDPNSDNVNRTIIHEGMHASKLYTTGQVHGMQAEIDRCANEYLPH